MLICIGIKNDKALSNCQVKHFDEEDKHNSCKGKWNKQTKVCVRALKTFITSQC